MYIKTVNGLFFTLVVSLIFPGVHKILQINFLGGAVQIKLIFIRYLLDLFIQSIVNINIKILWLMVY